MKQRRIGERVVLRRGGLLAVTALLLAVGSARAAEEVDEFPIKLFPLVEFADQPDGKHLSFVFFLYHRTTEKDGSTYSFNILNYLQWPEFTAVLPLYFRYGAEGRKHTLLVPFWFRGPTYTAAPLLLSGGWQRQAGGRALWITPFFHVNTRPDGSIEDLHALTWLQGDGYKVFLPLAYYAGDEGRKHLGIIPFWFSGPRYWTVPLALSGGWRTADGGRTDWIMPLFHHSQDAQGATTSFHVLNYLHGQDYDVVAPLAWRSGPEGARHYGVVPLWFSGPGYWCAPPLLSGGWKNAAGGTSTWMTPLAHTRTDSTGGIASYHVLNYFHGHELDIFFPLAWLKGPPGQRSGAFLPLYFQGKDFVVVLPLVYSAGRADQPGGRQLAVVPFWFAGKDWWMVPPLLTGQSRRADGGSTTWVTPLFHSSDLKAAGSSMHVVNWFSGQRGGGVDAQGKALPQTGYEAFFPLYYRNWKTVDGTTTANSVVLPLYFRGPDYFVAPLALSGKWWAHDGGTSTWITPLYHRDTAADGTMRSTHLLTWVAGQHGGGADAQGKALPRTGYEVLFPLYYRNWRTADGRTTAHTGLIPLYFHGPDYWVAPPALSGKWPAEGGGSNLWVTPLYHRSTDVDGEMTSTHVLNYVAGHRGGGVGSDGEPLAESGYHVLFPLFYRNWTAIDGVTTASNTGVIPFWFQGDNYWGAPLALSFWHRRGDGSDTTWITPLFHRNGDQDGKLTSLHALNYFQGPDYSVFFPLVYVAGKQPTKHVGVVPFWFSGPGYWTVPLALSGGWKRDSVGANGGGSRNWITPLVHYDRNPEGKVDAFHVLNYLHGPNQDVFFPLAWRTGEEGHRHWGLLPLWLSGPEYAFSPLALSGSWRRSSGGSTTWITPLFHRGTNADGKVTDWHALNLIHHRTTDIFFPLVWNYGADGDRHRNFLPLYFQGPKYLVVAPFFYQFDRPDSSSVGVVPFYFSGKDSWVAPLLLSAGWTTAAGGSTALITPLFHRTTGPTGEVLHEHLFNYVATPEISTLFPVYWNWRMAEGGRNSLLVPLYYQQARKDGDFTSAVIPALFSYHSGKNLDTSLGYQLFPFIYQHAADGSEFNLLWRIFHIREWKQGPTEVTVLPLWWSEHHSGAPAQWQILGGLVGRDCNYHTGSYRYRILWVIPVGGRGHFEPPVADTHAAEAITAAVR